MNKATYFVNEAAEYEFYLLHMDGEQRGYALGVSAGFYSNKKAANKWRDDIKSKLGPTSNPAAHEKLESMYQRMIDH
jgi:hypothetical protein